MIGREFSSVPEDLVLIVCFERRYRLFFDEFPAEIDEIGKFASGGGMICAFVVPPIVSKSFASCQQIMKHAQ